MFIILFLFFYAIGTCVTAIIGSVDYSVYSKYNSPDDKKKTKKGAQMAIFCWAWPAFVVLSLKKSIPELFRSAFQKLPNDNPTH